MHFFENSFWPVITDRLSELIETNTCKTKFVVLSNHWEQKSKAIVNKSTKLVILLSYTDVKGKLIFQKQSSDLSKNKKQTKLFEKL